MKNIILILVVLLHYQTLFSQDNSSLGTRLHINSSFLEEEREFQVYLPATYFFDDKTNYPVIYMLDGDYNFHYLTGLVELLSNVSGKIPECIVVGISDKGAKKYRSNCTPDQIIERNGNADNYMDYIGKELKPYIIKNYRTSNYNIIIGHSIGGLFVTNFSILRPEIFNTYIAIDPALWPGDFEIISRADQAFTDQPKLRTSYYISSSSAQGMGIDKYISLLQKHFPDSQQWTYYKFAEENHNSVGLLTIKKSLENIFKGWSISEGEFKSFKSANEVISHYKGLSEKFSTLVTIHPYFLGNIVYYYFNRDKKKDLLILEEGIKENFPGSLGEYYNQLATNYFENNEHEKAIEYYNKSIALNPQSFAAYDGLSKIFLAQEKYKNALNYAEKAIATAKSSKARQWMLNQLNANIDEINSNLQEKK